MRDPKERLRDILEAIAAIERYGDHDKAAFDIDELLQTWFVRNLQIIGEAASGLNDETRALAPAIPWSKIVGMRNVLVHGYFDIDAEIVWTTVQQDLPDLKADVQRLLRNLERGESKAAEPVTPSRPPKPKQPRGKNKSGD